MDHGLIAHDDQSFIVGKNMIRMGKRKYLLPFFGCKDTDVVTCTDGFSTMLLPIHADGTATSQIAISGVSSI